MAAHVNGGPGISAVLIENPDLLIYSLLNVEMNYATPIRPSRFSANLGPSLGFIWDLDKNLHAQIQSSLMQNVLARGRTFREDLAEIRWSFMHNAALGARYTHDSWKDYEATGLLYLYY